MAPLVAEYYGIYYYILIRWDEAKKGYFNDFHGMFYCHSKSVVHHSIFRVSKEQRKSIRSTESFTVQEGNMRWYMSILLVVVPLTGG